MQNYNKVVSVAREVARDQLRMSKVNSVRDEIMNLNTSVKNLEASLESAKKQIAIAEFKKTQVNEADPEKEAKLKTLEEKVAYEKKEVERLEKEIEGVKKEIAAKDAEIAKIEAGEAKVDAELLFDTTEKLLKEICKTVAVSKVQEAEMEPVL